MDSLNYKSQKNNELNNKIIAEQDWVTFYALSLYNSPLISETYFSDPEISYSKLTDYILSTPQLLDNFSTPNLINLFLDVEKSDKTTLKLLEDMIMQRLEKEDFSCVNIDQEFMLKAFYSSDVFFGKLTPESTQKIREKLINEVSQIKDKRIQNIISKQKTLSEVGNFIAYYKKGEFSDEKLRFIERLLEDDNESLRYANYEILEDGTFNLGEDFVKYLLKFPKLNFQLSLLQKNNPPLFDAFSQRVQGYSNLQDNYEEIKIMIETFSQKCFAFRADKIDMESLIEYSIRQSNKDSWIHGDVINVDYDENYDQNLEEEYQSLYKNARDLDKKKNVYLNKRFSLTLKDAQKLIEDYGSDLDNIDEISAEDIQFFHDLEHIVAEEDNSVVDLNFLNCSTQYKATDILNLKTRVANVFAKDYANTLNGMSDKVQNFDKSEIEFEGQSIPVIKVNGNFDILVHSSAAGFVNERKSNDNTNFAKQWLSGTDKANHIISMCFINQDFMGCAPVTDDGVMYGFTNIPKENIKLMGATDINTYSRSFSYSSASRKYMSSKTMPYTSRRVYNEFGIERDGTIPDYVILFDDMNDNVMKNSYRASMQFGIPILQVDKKDIEAQQLESLRTKLEEYKQTNNPDLLGNIINTYETNIAGWLLNRSDIKKDKTYTSEINNSRFLADFKKLWGEIESEINNYLENLKASPNIDNNLGELTKIVEIFLHEHDLYEHTEETKPISKTKLSFNPAKILDSINNVLEQAGYSELAVDSNNMPTEKDYQVSIKGLVTNALLGKNKVSLLDIQEIDNVMAMENEQALDELEDK